MCKPPCRMHNCCVDKVIELSPYPSPPALLSLPGCPHTHTCPLVYTVKYNIFSSLTTTSIFHYAFHIDDNYYSLLELLYLFINSIFLYCLLSKLYFLKYKWRINTSINCTASIPSFYI